MPLFRNRVAALLAIFAMALQGLLPLAAQAKAGGADLFDTICSVDGAKGGGQPLPAKGADHGKHCALCVAGGDRAAALPSSATSPLITDVAAHTAPSGFLPAGTSGPQFSPAHPRAPPVQS